MKRQLNLQIPPTLQELKESIAPGLDSTLQVSRKAARALGREIRTLGQTLGRKTENPGYGWHALLLAFAIGTAATSELPRTSPESLGVQQAALESPASQDLGMGQDQDRKSREPRKAVEFQDFPETRRRMIRGGQDQFQRLVQGTGTRETRSPASAEVRNNLLLDAIAFAESQGNPNAVSHAGARGPYQIMPSTLPSWKLRDLHCVEKSRIAAQQILADKARFARGNLLAVLFAYNAGQNRPGYREWLGSLTGDPETDMQSIPIGESKAYVHKVLEAYMTLAQIRGLEDHVAQSLREGRTLRAVNWIPRTRQNTKTSESGNRENQTIQTIQTAGI